MKILKLLLMSPFLWFLYLFSFCMPRSKRLWVFGSYKDLFNDNSKYLFLETSFNDPSIHAVWLTGSRSVVSELRVLGVCAFHRWSLAGVWYALRAHVHVYSAYLSDTNYWLSGNAKRISLWHGVPLKKIAYDIDTGPRYLRHHGSFLYRLPYLALTPYFFSKPSIVLAPSKYLADILVSAFDMHSHKILDAKYPRLDAVSFSQVLSGKYRHTLDAEAKTAASDLFSKTDGRRVLYAPTWRDNDPDFISGTPINWRNFDAMLEEKNIKFFIKLHPNSICSDNFFDEYKRIVLIKNVNDIYPALQFFECLITDYSSIYYDYLFLDRKIIFFPYDMSTYIDSGRSMYAEYEKMTPGVKVFDESSLLQALSTIDKNEYKADRERVSKLVWGDGPGIARPRLKNLLARGFI